MKSNASFVYNLCLVLGDFLALVAAFVVAYIQRVSLDSRPLVDQVPAMTYLTIFLILLPFWILIFAMLGLYSSNIYEKRFSEFGRLFMGSFIGLLFVIGCDFVWDAPIFPARLVPIYAFVLAFVFLVLFRTIARLVRTSLFHFDIGLTHTLIVGNTAVTKELVTDLSHKSSGYHILGVVGDTGVVRNFPQIPVFASFLEATKHTRKQKLHTIIQTELYADAEHNNEILNFAQKHHVAYRFIPGNTELFVGNIDVELFRSSIPVIAVHQTPLLGWGRALKRIFDTVAALVALILLSPLLLLITVLMLVFDPGPIVFRQKRITRFHTPFRIYKFRTMKKKYNGISPEAAFTKMGKPELIATYRNNGDFIPNDPRVTRLGRFMRATSLDELPQLLNVIRGDLSLVGPRALVPEEIDAAESKHHILSVKSGLTGLAQVSGRKDIPYDERRKLDLYYIQNWTFWLDLTILVKTFRVLITKS